MEELMLTVEMKESQLLKSFKVLIVLICHRRDESNRSASVDFTPGLGTNGDSFLSISGGFAPVEEVGGGSS